MGEKVIMLNEIEKTNIHQYQFDALKKIEKYFSSSGIFPALVKMPTGERVIIVTGCINALISRVSEAFIKNKSCIA